MLKMNYSDFSSKTTNQIEKAARKRGINPYRISRENLIGMIIAHDAYYEGKNNATSKTVEIKMPEKRKDYCLSEGGEADRFLRLTDTQVNFFNWLKDNYVSPYNSELEPISDMDFEAP